MTFTFFHRRAVEKDIKPKRNLKCEPLDELLLFYGSQDFLLYLVPIKQKFMSTWSGITYTFMLNVWIVSFGQDIKLVLNIK